MVIPSLTDPSVAPPGKHVMSCFVQYAPYKLRPDLNWDDQERSVWRQCDRHDFRIRANMKDIILHKQVLDAARSRTRIWPERRQYFSGRTFARTTFLPAAGAGLGAYRTPIETFICADRPRIRAAASWALRGGWPQWKFLKTQGSGLDDARSTRRRHRWRWPQWIGHSLLSC